MQSDKFDPSKIDWDSHDKQSAAWHEAGHATVASVFCWKMGRGKVMPAKLPDGRMVEVQIGLVRVHIERHEPTDPIEEKTWVGATQTMAMELDEMERATVHVAGVVAEYLYSDGDGTDASFIMDDWEGGVIEFSPTDESGIPDSWGDRQAAVERALTMLREHRPLLDAIAQRLAEEEYLTDGELKELMESN